MGANRPGGRALYGRGARGPHSRAERRLTRTALTPTRALWAALAALCTAAGAWAGSAGASGPSAQPQPRLFVTGGLADFDHRPLDVKRAAAEVLASEPGRGSPGIQRIQVLVDGRRVARSPQACGKSCPSSATTRFIYSRHRFGDSHHRVVIEATDGHGATAQQEIDVEPVPAASGAGAPAPLPAFYLTAPNVSDLRSQAYAAAARFARHQTQGRGLLVLDFGASRLHHGVYGVRLRGGTFFSNDQIHSALQAALRGYHDHHRGGRATIVYTTSNALLGSSGNGDTALKVRSAHEAGRRQALALRGLHLYRHTSTAVGGDIEPGYDLIAPPKVSVSLVSGAVSAPGSTPFYDVGTAPCNGPHGLNGWTIGDICAVASGRGRRAVPEIYYGPPLDQLDDWRAAAVACNIDSFAGVSGSVLADYSPPQSWRLLRSSTRAQVGRILVVFPQ